jgi:transketolase
MRDNMDLKAINALRFLGVDAINKANSGHPGIVLGAAPMLYTLFSKHMNIDVRHPSWFNRDRFVLSAGHGSMALYAMNHLCGYNITIDDLKRFRALGNTPGHPEYGHTEGVETTSGPLGQGISNAVGMAIAEAHLAARFNTPDHALVDHHTYVLLSDGDLQEGVAMESMSLAGHFGLSKLIALYDSNDIQLDGPLSLAFSEDIKKRMEAIGWQYIRIDDGNDIDAINRAINRAKRDDQRPSLIEVRTTIGYGAPMAGTSKVHGAPLGDADTDALRKKLGWTHAPFDVPEDVYTHIRKGVTNRGKRAYNKWKKTLSSYRAKHPEKAEQFEAALQGRTRALDVPLDDIAATEKDATRNVSGKIINRLSEHLPNLIGGSADLTSSTKAKGADGNFSASDRLGRNINYGVREHAMGAITNGIVLHGGLIAFAGAFFVFSDYMKAALRLSAIMEIPSVWVFSHDSVAVGEDGPTHQPVEQLAGLRAISNLNVFRPADAKETVAAWRSALTSKKTPTAIILTRQDVKTEETTSSEDALKGAYIVRDTEGKPDGTLLSAGSEVGLCLKAADILSANGIKVRVVSMPSDFLFERQTKTYKKSVLGNPNRVLAVEMASPMPWYKYARHVMGLERFGVSAKGDVAASHLGFTPEAVAERFKSI